MNGYVSKLFDVDSLTIPNEMLETNVDEQRIDDEITQLSRRYADEMPADIVANDDVVYCIADEKSYPDKRTIILYPGADMPGAQEAAAATVGKIHGCKFTAQLAGRPVNLKIINIIRRIPAEVNDALIKKMGIEGVGTLNEYKDYLYNKIAAEMRMENEKALMRYYMEQLEQNSEYAYDEAEMQSFIDSEYDKAVKDYAAEGIEASPEEIKDAIMGQQKQTWLAQAFCKEHGIDIDEQAVEQNADQMQEMMSLMGEDVPEREELLNMARTDETLNALFGYIGNLINEKMEGSNGNG